MPWAWELAVACLDMTNGQIRHWPIPTGRYQDNQFLLEACWRVWRVFHLHAKPRATNGQVNWSSSDIDLYSYLQDNAHKGWVMPTRDVTDGE